MSTVPRPRARPELRRGRPRARLSHRVACRCRGRRLRRPRRCVPVRRRGRRRSRRSRNRSRRRRVAAMRDASEARTRARPPRRSGWARVDALTAGRRRPCGRRGRRHGARQKVASSSSSQNRVSDAPAMSKEVQNSPTLRLDDVDARVLDGSGRCRRRRRTAPRTSPSRARSGSGDRAPTGAFDAVGQLGQQTRTRRSREAVGGRDVGLPIPGSPWMPSRRHPALRHREQRLGGSRQVQPVNATPKRGCGHSPGRPPGARHPASTRPRMRRRRS